VTIYFCVLCPESSKMDNRVYDGFSESLLWVSDMFLQRGVTHMRFSLPCDEQEAARECTDVMTAEHEFFKSERAVFMACRFFHTNARHLKRVFPMHAVDDLAARLMLAPHSSKIHTSGKLSSRGTFWIYRSTLVLCVLVRLSIVHGKESITPVVYENMTRYVSRLSPIQTKEALELLSLTYASATDAPGLRAVVHAVVSSVITTADSRTLAHDGLLDIKALVTLPQLSPFAEDVGMNQHVQAVCVELGRRSFFTLFYQASDLFLGWLIGDDGAQRPAVTAPESFGWTIKRSPSSTAMRVSLISEELLQTKDRKDIVGIEEIILDTVVYYIHCGHATIQKRCLTVWRVVWKAMVLHVVSGPRYLSRLLLAMETKSGDDQHVHWLDDSVIVNILPNAAVLQDRLVHSGAVPYITRCILMALDTYSLNTPGMHPNGCSTAQFYCHCLCSYACIFCYHTKGPYRDMVPGAIINKVTVPVPISNTAFLSVIVCMCMCFVKHTAAVSPAFMNAVHVISRHWIIRRSSCALADSVYDAHEHIPEVAAHAIQTAERTGTPEQAAKVREYMGEFLICDDTAPCKSAKTSHHANQ
jgi:hypothetical protein